MPKAEVGSNKYLSNKLKAKGLTRLRWYCQVCEKPCRDAHAFKMHTQSESHVRQMLVVGEDPRKYVEDFSKQFLHDFVQLLKTGHGEKQVQINRFYQEYIANRDHIHMNATKWPSLTEFAKHLGRESICRVEETDKGLQIAWIDDSPEALRRRDAVRRKEMQDLGNEEIEQRIIREQIKRAQANVKTDAKKNVDEDDGELKRMEGDKIKFSFGAKPAAGSPDPKPAESPEKSPSAEADKSAEQPEAGRDEPSASAKPSGFGGMSLKMAAKPQAKNVFAQAKKSNPSSSGSKKARMVEQPKKMSEAERIMKQEMERKRSRESAGFSMPGGKKQKS